ncbi:unnamed protein product [Urochloa decumbens]|uniref:Hexosyltransferase n=1 Tax=Urochloa decumbens TaxID=240449 RepID=A0ABC9H4Z7_9POAL
MTTNAVAAPPATRAYVTFLAGDGEKWKVVVELAERLREVGSAYQLVVAVLPDVPESRRRILVSHGCVVREIQPVHPPDENQAHLAMDDYVTNYSKLRIWEFVEYERMVYLDADIQVLENIDELFELDKGHFYAIVDGFCDGTWSHTPQYKAGYSQQQFFNARMFVHEPSMATAKALLDTLRVTPPTFSEQDLLNMFFREQFKPIPPVYNLAPAMLLRHPEKVQPEEVKVDRYCPDKETSYMDQERIEMLLKKRSGLPADDGEVGKKLPAFGKNLPAVATLAASSAAAGVVAAAASPPICFCFYAVFMAAMAFITISLRRM